MSDDDDDEKPAAGMIIHLFGAPPAVDGAPTVNRERRSDICRRDEGSFAPHAPLVDSHTRLVTCSRCKAPLDAFDVLLEVARRHEEWNRLSSESRTMRKEIEAMKAEEKRVKARTKSHARKDAASAVAAEREKLAEQHAEIACRTDDARRALKRIDQLIGRRFAKEQR
jgi:hypothetical protein